MLPASAAAHEKGSLRQTLFQFCYISRRVLYEILDYIRYLSHIRLYLLLWHRTAIGIAGSDAYRSFDGTSHLDPNHSKPEGVLIGEQLA